MAAYNQSKIKLFRRCQKAYDFRYGEYAPAGKEMTPKVPKLALQRGTWMHELQAALHREWAGVGFDTWEDKHNAMAETFYLFPEETRVDLGDLPDECDRLFRAYLRRWRDDRSTYRVATLHDGAPAIEFMVEASLQRWGIDSPFKGRLDLLVEDDEFGGLWVWDAKWVKTLPNPDERMMSPQALMYVWALQKIGYDIRGFVFNYGRTKPPAIPDTLKSTGLLTMKHSLDSDFYTYVREIQRLHGSEWRRWAKRVYREKLLELKGREQLWFRRERIPTEPARIQQALREFLVSIKDIERRETRQHLVPRSYFYNCRWGCDYHDLCVSQFNGLDIAPLIKRDFEFVEERYIGEGDLLSA